MNQEANQGRKGVLRASRPSQWKESNRRRNASQCNDAPVEKVSVLSKRTLHAAKSYFVRPLERECDQTVSTNSTYCSSSSTSSWDEHTVSSTESNQSASVLVLGTPGIDKSKLLTSQLGVEVAPSKDGLNITSFRMHNPNLMATIKYKLIELVGDLDLETIVRSYYSKSQTIVIISDFTNNFETANFILQFWMRSLIAMRIKTKSMRVLVVGINGDENLIRTELQQMIAKFNEINLYENNSENKVSDLCNNLSIQIICNNLNSLEYDLPKIVFDFNQKSEINNTTNNITFENSQTIKDNENDIETTDMGTVASSTTINDHENDNKKSDVSENFEFSEKKKKSIFRKIAKLFQKKKQISSK